MLKYKIFLICYNKLTRPSLANKKTRNESLCLLLGLDSIHSSIPYIYSLYYQYYLAGWGSQTFLGARLSRRAHNPQSGFCAFKASRKFKSTPRYFLSTLYFLADYFISILLNRFSIPYLDDGLVRCRCAIGSGIYRPDFSFLSFSVFIFPLFLILVLQI